MVACGIGGRTIDEAQENMSYEEAISWSVYMRKRGSLHVGRRLEQGFALIATAIYQCAGHKVSQSDFMPHEDQDEISIEEAMARWA